MDIIKEIYEAVMEGKVEETANRVQQALNAKSKANDILNKGLIAAMDVVGEKFGEGELFIPQVLWSAKAMQAGMDLLKSHFSSSDRTARGTVVIGTAKGDIHDIGKNLVAMMLEGAGFEIKDLGTDVTPEKFVDAVRGGDVNVVALSALLTTTMPNMKNTVEALKAAGLRDKVKVIIGGAPVTEAYAKQIGADGYSPDASRAVSLAKTLVA